MPETEGEPKAENSGLQIARLAALLDFYSDRATAHASLFVASIFGLFASLAIVQDPQGFFVLLSILVYFALAYAGYFTLARFGYYAGIAHRLNSILENQLVEQEMDRQKIEDLFQYICEQNKLQQQIMFHKRLVRRFSKNEAEALRRLFALLYWILTSSIGLIVYSKFLNNWIKGIPGIIIFILLMFPLLLLFVILPYLLKESKTERKRKCENELKEWLR